MGPAISRKPIEPEERLIVALDVPGTEEALSLVERLGDAVHFYKVGLELAMSGRYFELIDELGQRGKKVFADLKFLDIPATVAAAVRQLAKRDIELATLHGQEQEMIRRACAEKGPLKLLAVTVLTSMKETDFPEFGSEVAIRPLVLSRAKRAVAGGCDGVVASGAEARDLRTALGEECLIVCPGIRLGEGSDADDQNTARVVTPRAAFESGADYIVVGRDVRGADDPRAVALSIQQTIANLFA